MPRASRIRFGGGTVRPRSTTGKCWRTTEPCTRRNNRSLPRSSRERPIKGRPHSRRQKTPKHKRSEAWNERPSSKGHQNKFYRRPGGFGSQLPKSIRKRNVCTRLPDEIRAGRSAVTHEDEMLPNLKAISPVEASRMKYSPGAVPINVSRCCLPSSSVSTCLIHNGVPSSIVLKMSKPNSIRTSRLRRQSNSWLPLRQEAGDTTHRPPIYTTGRKLDVQP